MENKLSNKSMETIYGLERSSKDFNIYNIKKLLDKIGNPEKKSKIIHVAGTNGKGSVCAMVDSALRESGFKVGLFTSPHLVRINERIRIDGKVISDKEFDNLGEEVLDLQKKFNIKLTFFEAIAAMAFIYFERNKLDYAVMEVGLGGRLDATNVCDAIISVITSIGIDHTENLGNSIREIAEEKAGIIKEDSVVVTLNEGEALDVIKEKCREKHARLIVAEATTEIKSGLKGDYQTENTSIAVAVLKELKINKKDIVNGIKKTKWPGRFEFLEKNVLVDCAHNASGINALVESVKELKYDKLILVFGVMKDKEIKEMAEKLEELNSWVIVTRPKIERAANAKEVAGYFKKSIVIEDSIKAVGYAKKLAGKDDLVLVCGSIYLIGEIYTVFKKSPE
ncbi:MAG: bifunctional folylpolyglutamate synthase/dihydrofolate synthase [Candidatus Nanoarchaeia archaeon]|nr:bifunctional folylpolyglutamate synthase/dihydrofolate synthase [Candidatus Nanoarchaeia archaeon]